MDRLFVAPLFDDRIDAARALAVELAGRPPDTVVVGLARGGVEVAAGLARRLDALLDVVAVRKIGHPLDPEYALGAATPGDGVYLRNTGELPHAVVEAAIERAKADATALDRRLHAEHPPLDLHGQTAIAVDDGLATGATMIAALRFVRARGAAHTIAAVPVGAAQSLALLHAEADEVVCPYELDDFFAVGVWYRRFDQVEDAEVLRLLAEARTRAPFTPPVASGGP